MKTINLELSKRLAHYLENINVKYFYEDWFIIYKWWVDIKNYKKLWLIKTLTLEEVIEVLPKYIFIYNKYAHPYIDILNNTIYYWYWAIIGFGEKWETLLQAAEKILEYLLDNNLLWK